MLLGLPYEEVWLLDFEFIARPGAEPEVVCMVAREMVTHRLIRLWADDLPEEPPFRTDYRVLFVTFYASAEWGCFLQLGWTIPTRIIDLYAESGARPTACHYPPAGAFLVL